MSPMAYAAWPAGTLPGRTFAAAPNKRRSIAGPFLGRSLLPARHNALQFRHSAVIRRSLRGTRILRAGSVVGIVARIVVAVVAIFVESVLGEIDLVYHDTDAISHRQQRRHRR